MAKQSEYEKSHSLKLPTFKGGDKQLCDWVSADPQLVLDLIGKMAKLGGAIRFGYTRDGGAYSVGFYLGDDRRTEYIRPSEDLNDRLHGFIVDLEDNH